MTGRVYSNKIIKVGKFMYTKTDNLVTPCSCVILAGNIYKKNKLVGVILCNTSTLDVNFLGLGIKPLSSIKVLASDIRKRVKTNGYSSRVVTDARNLLFKTQLDSRGDLYTDSYGVPYYYLNS